MENNNNKVKLNTKLTIIGLFLPLIGIFFSGFFTDNIKARSLRKGSALSTLILLIAGFILLFIIAGNLWGQKY